MARRTGPRLLPVGDEDRWGGTPAQFDKWAGPDTMTPSGRWRNRSTQGTQNPLGARPCGFGSHPAHLVAWGEAQPLTYMLPTAKVRSTKTKVNAVTAAVA